MASLPEVDVAVVGAGVAGLAAALAFQAHGAEVFVVDASDRPGGVMRTDHVRGYVVERGPNTIEVKIPMLTALRDQGLEDTLRKAEPASKHRFILRDGVLVAAPLSPFSLLGTSLLGPGGKLRLLAEPLLPRRDASDESVSEFITRRLGRQVADRLVGPFLTGVYAGDERELGAEAVFGTLVDWERRLGSVVLGALAAAFSRRSERGLRGVYSTTEGLGPFARHLAERLHEPPALGATVRTLRREGTAWHLSVSTEAGGDTTLRAGRVVLAVPSLAAAALLRESDARVAELLEDIDYAPIVGVPLGVARSQLSHEVRGFGFLVPRETGEAAGMDLLGCLFMSQLFPGRAPADHELLQCILGGVRRRDIIDDPDDRIVERTLQDLDPVLGIGGEPEVLGVTRWPRAIPQPGRAHVRRMNEVGTRVGALPGLALAGSYVAGVGVADSFASGLRAAADLVRPL